MQTMVFTGRLAADPQISDDFGKAVFRLLEQRGVDGAGKPRLVGVNCVSWSKGLNEKVIARGLAQGCEAVVVGAFIDTSYATRDGQDREAPDDAAVEEIDQVLDEAPQIAADRLGEGGSGQARPAERETEDAQGAQAVDAHQGRPLDVKLRTKGPGPSGVLRTRPATLSAGADVWTGRCRSGSRMPAAAATFET